MQDLGGSICGKHGSVTLRIRECRSCGFSCLSVVSRLSGRVVVRNPSRLTYAPLLDCFLRTYKFIARTRSKSKLVRSDERQARGNLKLFSRHEEVLKCQI